MKAYQDLESEEEYKNNKVNSMKDIIKGYRQIIAGWFALLVLTPGIFLSAVLITMLIKYIYKMILWLW